MNRTSLYKTYRYLVITLFFVYSCEDVIEVDIPSEPPRLVIDALVRVNVNENFTNVVVKVSETSSFFESIPIATLDQITLTNIDNPPSGNEAILFEDSPGVYSRSFPTEELMTDNYVLQINYNGEIFLAFSQFEAAPEINSIIQGDATLFDDDDIEVIVNYNDIPDEENFYLFDFDFDEFLATEDTFYQDQEFEFSYFYDEPLEIGTEVEVSILGINEDFYNYMNLLIDQSGQQDVGVFATPSVTVRGNFINATDIDNIDNFDNVDQSDNFALGYFAIVQENKSSFIVQ
ncbi:MAG: DUF4249 family protein [bacterium]